MQVNILGMGGGIQVSVFKKNEQTTAFEEAVNKAAEQLKTAKSGAGEQKQQKKQPKFMHGELCIQKVIAGKPIKIFMATPPVIQYCAGP